MTKAKNTSFGGINFSTASTTVIVYTILVPRKLSSLLFPTWKFPLHGVNFVKYDLLLNVCLKQPWFNIHLPDFWIPVVIYRAFQVVLTITTSVCSSLFRFPPLCLKRIFAMRTTAPDPKHHFSFCYLASHYQPFFTAFASNMAKPTTKKNFCDNSGGVIDATKSYCGRFLAIAETCFSNNEPRDSLTICLL